MTRPQSASQTAFAVFCARDLGFGASIASVAIRTHTKCERGSGFRSRCLPQRGTFSSVMTHSTDGSAASNASLWSVLSLDCANVVSAEFVSQNGENVQAIWSQRDLVASRKRFFSTTYMRSGGDNYAAAPPTEITDAAGVDCYYSPSREKYLKFSPSSKNGANGEGSGSIIAEVWTVGGGLDLAWEIDGFTHGPVFNDEWFGSVSWSPDESMVVYTADRPKPAPPSDDGKSKQYSWAHQLHYRFHENARDPFGEAYIGRRSPTLFIADVVHGGSYPLCSPDSEEFQRKIFGEPQWSPDGDMIAATMRRSTDTVDSKAAESEEFLPADLGLRYCYNRPSSIVAFDAPNTSEDLKAQSRSMRVVSSEREADDFCCNSPRFSPDGKDILYLSGPRFGNASEKGKALPHNTTKVLRSVRVGSNGLSSPRTLIGVPHDPGHKDFPGLYLHSLLKSAWLDSNTVVLSTAWGSVNKVLSITFARDNGQLVPAGEDPKVVDWGLILSREALESQGVASHDNVNVLDVCEGGMLIAVNNPVTPTILFSIRATNWTGSECRISIVSQNSSRARALQGLLDSAHTADLVLQTGGVNGTARTYNADNDENHSRFQVTVLLPQAGKGKSPLIVYPHGGPHVATLNGYSQGTVALLKLGFAVMYVNYRGSLGLGQKSLETLPGNVGTQEIDEVVQATRWALANAGFSLDAERVGFLGGSHSGFIGAHTSLIPGLFKRTVLRNPVVNIATMVGATDIPDWCFCEADVNSENKNGLRYAPDADQLRVMYEHSPVSKVRPISSSGERPGPTLLQVGGSDRRVPPQQSLEWKRIMTQAYGEDNVTIRWYPNSGHAIDEVPNGDDAWVHALDFLCQV